MAEPATGLENLESVSFQKICAVGWTRKRLGMTHQKYPAVSLKVSAKKELSCGGVCGVSLFC